MKTALCSTPLLKSHDLQLNIQCTLLCLVASCNTLQWPSGFLQFHYGYRAKICPKFFYLDVIFPWSWALKLQLEPGPSKLTKFLSKKSAGSSMVVMLPWINGKSRSRKFFICWYVSCKCRSLKSFKDLMQTSKQW